jgi:hypothetical protein
MDTIGFHVPTKQIGTFQTLKLIMSQRLSPSVTFVTAAYSICRSLEIFNKHTISLEDTLSFA